MKSFLCQNISSRYLNLISLQVKFLSIVELTLKKEKFSENETIYSFCFRFYIMQSPFL